MGTILYSTTLTTLTCGTCQIPFAMPSNMHRRVVESGDWFYCPNGHKIHYYEDENSKLKRQLEQEQQRLIRERSRTDQARAEAQHERRRAAAARGQLTKTKKRIGNGVCPVSDCKRHFKNVEAHVKRMHPAYVSDAK